MKSYIGRHKGRNGMMGCILCGDECEGVVYVLWECLAYKDSREEFAIKLRAILGEAFKDFEVLNSFEKAYFVLGHELWMENFDSLVVLVKEYIINMWEARKVKLPYNRLFLRFRKFCVFQHLKQIYTDAERY